MLTLGLLLDEAVVDSVGVERDVRMASIAVDVELEITSLVDGEGTVGHSQESYFHCGVHYQSQPVQ